MCSFNFRIFLIELVLFISNILGVRTEANSNISNFPYKVYLNYTLGKENYIRFFNENIEKEISNYLCTVDNSQSEKKCCSCNPNCVGNCCIDALWESATTGTLQEYLNMFVERYKFRKCQPIIPVNTTEHVVEHLYMVHSYYNGSKKIECPEKTFPIPVRSTKGEVYISAACAVLNEDMMFEPLEITVSCEKATNISEGQVFSLRHLQKARKCMFSEFIHKGNKLSPIIYQLDGCNEKYNDLCSAYMLRIKGYRNPHCLLCDFKNSINNFQVESCHDNNNKNNNNNSKNNDNYCTYDYNTNDSILKNTTVLVTYKLIANRNMQYVIMNLRALFPVKEFLGLSEISDEFDEVMPYFLCHEIKVKGCCVCDISCFKGQFCCMDILWNTSHPKEINEYKQMLITHSKQYYASCETFNGSSSFNSSCLSTGTMSDLNTCMSMELNKSDIKGPISEHLSRNLYYDLCYSHVEPNYGIRNINCILCKNLTNFTYYLKSGCLDNGNFVGKIMNFFVEPLHDPLVCQIGQVFNSAKGRCEPIRCQENLELRGSKCVPRENKNLLIHIKESTFKSCLTNNGLNLFLEYHERSNLSENLCMFLNMTKCHPSNDTISIKVENRTTYIKKIEIKMSVEFLEDLSSRYSELQNILEQSESAIRITSSPRVILNKFHQIDYFNNFPNYKVCHKIRVLDVDLVNFTSNCGIIFNNSLYSRTNVSTWIIWDKQKIKRLVSICDRSYLSSICALIYLPNLDINLNEDGSITYKKGVSAENTLKVDEYVPTDQGVLTCIDFLRIMRGDLFLSLQNYISLICLSISIPSYILVFSTFCFFDKLRTIPGKCTLMLTCSLLIGDALLLSSTIIQVKDITIEVSLCKAISILIHFALLLAQTWCFAIALDLTLTFNSITSLITQRGSKRFHAYFTATVGSSLCFVTLSVLMDYFKIVNYDYAKDNICMPHGSSGHMYFYLIPTLVGFLSSLILLVKMMLNISYDVRRSKNVLGSNRTINVVSMGLKLALVLGLSEGIGFTGFTMASKSGSTGNEKKIFKVISIVYSFIRSLRGLFLALVYLCRKDVSTLYKEKWSTIVSRAN